MVSDWHFRRLGVSLVSSISSFFALVFGVRICGLGSCVCPERLAFRFDYDDGSQDVLDGRDGGIAGRSNEDRR